jgi:23S rRNA (cytosine1962-C5)-methyltransferase
VVPRVFGQARLLGGGFGGEGRQRRARRHCCRVDKAGVLLRLVLYIKPHTPANGKKVPLAKRPIVRLRPREGRRVRAGAPWVFSNEMTMDERAKALAPGTLVGLAAEDGTVLGTGYFNPRSLIGMRMLAKPDAQIDSAFFAERFRHALRLRDRFYDTPFYRLVHAEGDGLPGLVVDRFGDLCVVQIATAGMETLTESMLATLDAVIAPKCVILRNDVSSRGLEGLDLYVRTARGEAPSRIAIEENGVTYFADPGGGQKSGWYYDQRANRAFIANLAKDARVLDAYCYSGGFAVAAAARGAKQAVGLDSSEPALKLASEAAAANGLSERCRFVKCDVFEELERLAQAGERFNIVICDPPPFAPSRKDLESAARAYRKLARAAASLVAPGGFLMLASCSHNMPAERFAAECASGLARAGRRAALIREAGAGPDHPVHPMLPETSYLKTLTYAVD